MSDELLVLAREQLQPEMREAFPAARCFLLDADYNVPDAGAVAHEFAWELLALLKENGISYDKAFDCEDFAIVAWGLAKRKHWQARVAGQAVAQSVAIGILCFNEHGEPARGHCLCVMRTRGGLRAWEPHTGAWRQLSAQERRSAWLVMM
jgi:hypothetical protein